MEEIVFVEKKVSKMTKAFYLFLKTSKYGSIFLVLGVAILGGAIILGFSPKTEKAELFPTQYEGDWQNMEMALNRDLSEKANILEFNNNNSASVTDPKKEIYGEFSDDDIISPEEEPGEPEIENGEIQDSNQRPEPTEEIEPAKDDETEDKNDEDETTEVEVEENEIKEDEIKNPVESNIPFSEPVESSTEEFSFFKKTKNIFFISEARAEEIDESIVDESQEIPQTENEDVEAEEIQNDQSSEKDLDEKEKEDNEEFQSEDNSKEVIEPPEQEDFTQEIEATNDLDKEKEADDDIDKNDQGERKNEEAEKEKFEDYSGMISIPDVDGNLFSETQDQDKTIEEPQTIFTKELNAIYSGFPVPEKNGELQKLRAGFSFASFGEKDEDDEIIISWSLDEQNWNTVSEFVLNKNYSNKKNGGYFYADVFDLSDSNQDVILEWDDIKDIKIKFAYLTNNNENNYVPLFLDMVWLETESEKINEELEVEKEKRIKVLSQKKDFKINEDLEFKFKYEKERAGLLDPLISIAETIGITDYWKDINLTAEIMGPDRKIFEIPGEKFGSMNEIFTLEDNGEISVKLKKDKRFKPGLYKIILKIEEGGEIQTFEQDFTWGVLAVNVNKSIYLLGEKAYLQMGVLKDDGHTICDARLELRIKNLEFRIETLLSTEDGTIEYSGQCSGNNVTDVPDYFAYYTTGEAGIYEMELTNLDNGYEITDSFEVRDSVSFEIERIGPSRIYPPADYGMVLKIKANEDFEGFIQEKIPVSFVIMNQELRIKNQETGEFEIYDGQFITQDENDNIKLLRWHDLNLKQNDELEIKYAFDAPDVSPDLHLLGPLGFYE